MITQDSFIFDEWRKKFTTAPFVPKQLRLYFEPDEDRAERQVEVHIYDVKWLKKEHKDLYNKLTIFEDIRKYNNELIRALLEKQYFTVQLIPYFLLHVLKIIVIIRHHYYILHLTGEKQIGMMASLLLMQLVQELMQFYSQKWIYLLSLLNWVQLTTLTLNTLILVQGILQHGNN